MKFQANIPFKLTKLFYEKLGEQPVNKRVLVIRDLFTAMHASIDNAVTFVTDDKEAHELFNKHVVSSDEFGNNDTTILVDTEINKNAWKDFIKEISNTPKFDVAITTLGHDNLHLKFLEKVIPIAYKVVNISPDTWCAKHNRWKNIFQNYKNSAVGKPIEYEHIEHREANDLFCLGNQIESLGIMVYDENNDNKIDLTKFGFSEKEFSLYNKIMSDKKGKLIWRKNGINIIEPKNSTKKFIQPVNIWHGGDTCYEAAIGESRNHKKGKIQLQAEFDTKNELNNFQNSFKTKFMEWYYKFIVIPSVCKLHISMFVMSNYSKPWTDKRFCEYFGITGYISDTEAEANSEWETILNTMKEYV